MSRHLSDSNIHHIMSTLNATSDIAQSSLWADLDLADFTGIINGLNYYSEEIETTSTVPPSGVHFSLRGKRVLGESQCFIAYHDPLTKNSPSINVCVKTGDFKVFKFYFPGEYEFRVESNAGVSVKLQSIIVLVHVVQRRYDAVIGWLKCMEGNWGLSRTGKSLLICPFGVFALMKDAFSNTSSLIIKSVGESAFRMSIIRETIIRYMSIVSIHKYSQNSIWDLPVYSLSRLCAEDIQDIISCINSPLSIFSVGEVTMPSCESSDWLFNIIILVIRWASISEADGSDSDESIVSDRAVPPRVSKKVNFVDNSQQIRTTSDRVHGKWSKKKLLSAQQILRIHLKNFVEHTARPMSELYPPPTARDIKQFIRTLDKAMPHKIKKYLTESIGDVLKSLLA